MPACLPARDAEVLLACLNHAHSTEAEEIMGLLMGDIQVGPGRVLCCATTLVCASTYTGLGWVGRLHAAKAERFVASLLYPRSKALTWSINIAAHRWRPLASACAESAWPSRKSAPTDVRCGRQSGSQAGRQA